MYKVIKDFKDTDGTLYAAGDEYKGSLAKDRLNTLTTTDNKYNEVFIEEVKQKKKKVKKEAGD